MREHFDPNSVITPSTDEVMKSVARVLPIKLPHGFYESDTIPVESAQVVAQDILMLIEQIGCSPEQVLISGYPGGASHISKSEEDYSNERLLESIQECIEFGTEELLEIARRAEAGEHVSEDAIQIYQSTVADNQRLLQLLTDNPDMHQYFFGPATNLTDMSEYGMGDQHPVAYASIGGVIGIYDIEKIKALMERNNNDEDGSLTAYATPEEIRDALLVEYSPRFIESQ